MVARWIFTLFDRFAQMEARTSELWVMSPRDFRVSISKFRLTASPVLPLNSQEKLKLENRRLRISGEFRIRSKEAKEA
jgi:hypothetical protein